MDMIHKLQVSLFLVVLISLYILCSPATTTYNRNIFFNNDEWPLLMQQNVSNVTSSTSEWRKSGITTVTPWPELGKRPINQNGLNLISSTWTPLQPTVNVQTNYRFQTSSPGPNNTNNISHSQQNSKASQNTKATPGEVQDEELREFSESLLQKDLNSPARYVMVNYQGKTTSRSTRDEAPLSLIIIDQEAFNIPTIAKLTPLHNNYILEANVNEHVSPQERIEENQFLDALLSTQIMQFTRNFLISKGKVGRDPQEFKNILKEIWFNMYSRRGGKIGSSGFEHVFLAEVKNGDVSGLHNWIYFNEEEKKGDANYLGYMKKIDLGIHGAILKYHFTFRGLDKPVGSMFIGTSPELEIALYSTCFLLRPDHICPLKMNGHNFIIRTYTYRYRSKNMIGSAFPEI